MEHWFDVLIVGGGPSGSTMAYDLNQAGIRVGIVESRTRDQMVQRPKPCGGFVEGIFMKALPPGMNIEPVIEDIIDQTIFCFKGKSKSIAYPMVGPLYMTQRKFLDLHLLDQAQQSGVEVYYGVRARNFLYETGYYSFSDSGNLYAAPILIGADGAYSTVAREFNFKSKRTPYIVSEWDVEDPKVEECRGRVILELSANPPSYSWIFPKKDHVNIGWGGPRRVAATVHQETYQFGLKMGIQGESRQSAHLMTFTQWGEVVKDKVMLIGDAAGTVDPNTGGGISWGVRSGRAAAMAIKGSKLEDYQSWFDDFLMPEFRAAEAMRNCMVLSMLVLGKEVGNIVRDVIRILGGSYSYLHWKEEHSRLYRLGRILQPLVNRLMN